MLYAIVRSTQTKARLAACGLLMGAGFAFLASGLGTQAAYAAPSIGATLSLDDIKSLRAELTTAIVDVNAQNLTGVSRHTAMAAAIAQVTENAVATYGAGAASEITSVIIASAQDSCHAAGASATAPSANNCCASAPFATKSSTTMSPAATCCAGTLSADKTTSLTAPPTASYATPVADTCVSEADIGDGLGEAVALLASTNMDAAKAIAQTVANEGPYDIRSSFITAANAAGGADLLTTIAAATAQVTGSTGLRGGGGTFRGGLPASLPPPPPPCSNPSCT
jgi:hypothetical protein